MATKKGNIRSMRFSDEIVRIIEAQEGDTFTAKFERLVYKCIQELPQKREDLKAVQERIHFERQRLARIQKKTLELERNISTMNDAIKYTTARAKQVTGELDKLIEGT